MNLSKWSSPQEWDDERRPGTKRGWTYLPGGDFTKFLPLISQLNHHHTYFLALVLSCLWNCNIATGKGETNNIQYLLLNLCFEYEDAPKMCVEFRLCSFCSPLYCVELVFVCVCIFFKRMLYPERPHFTNSNWFYSGWKHIDKFTLHVCGHVYNIFPALSTRHRLIT